MAPANEARPRRLHRLIQLEVVVDQNVVAVEVARGSLSPALPAIRHPHPFPSDEKQLPQRPNPMDITSFVVQGRDKALLYGDYSTYHSQLVKRLLNARKKLGIATRNRGKFRKADEVTVESVAQNREYVHLLLLTSERAWAQAMSIKAAHSANQKGIAGRTRSHIISRLDKAARAAEHLAALLAQPEAAGATARDLLEARAYASLVRGAMQFQKHEWERCLRSYATTHVIYGALAAAGGRADVFRDLLAETVDPSIRYAAYQLKTPRTVPIPVIASKAFPRSDDGLVREIDRIDRGILALAEGAGADDAASAAAAAAASPVETIAWRSREVKIEDAQIAAAWAAVGAAKQRLAEAVARLHDKGPHEMAAAYDEILTATQDAVDATKDAIDELRGEGVGQADPRMQGLQITRTAVNYEMVSWRIGRNRVLSGPRDGATEEYGALRRKRAAASRAAPAEDARASRDLAPSKKLAKLKEKAALYDGTLQNLESIKELPGVAADGHLAAKIQTYEQYFTALKYLAIARSHAITGNAANALALIHRASTLHRAAASKLPSSSSDDNTAADAAAALPPSLDVSPDAFRFLGALLDGELQRHRAIVHVDALRAAPANADPASGSRVAAPLVERLHEYPLEGVDLARIVEFPPAPALVPVKPIFLDVAWNYIHYPGQVAQAAPAGGVAGAQGDEKPAAAAPKRGWFGFGR
ncbi:Signal recognition particle subunit SRP68 [Escovopsis weberi]|uniref:Signal recognition particle subunit SRP68 n=1 Tax=Escovopsis weberi TaxID=150374 RepID=A0A0M9VT06_ESCWE|nr:Signal recognition particle subunit SRP68 [Escovopsis weberi]